MKTNSFFHGVMILLALVPCARGQGTFVYDQQSAFDDATLGEGSIAIMANQPLGQSFTPSLSSVGFIRLQLYGGSTSTGSGTTLQLNLRSDSISGPIISSTDPVFLPNGWLAGYVTFTFSTPVPVIPGATYYFQPTVQSGDWTVGSSNPSFNYPGGTAFYRGNPLTVDLLFREGVIVPEPSSIPLALLGAGLVYLRRTRRSRPSR